MAREVSINACKALLNGKNCKLGGVCQNTYVGIGYGEVNTEIKDGTMYLFGNAIAKVVDGKLYVRIHTNSNTTRERLNTLSMFGYNISVCQRNYNAYINGKEVDDYMAWQRVTKLGEV